MARKYQKWAREEMENQEWTETDGDGNWTKILPKILSDNI